MRFLRTCLLPVCLLSSALAARAVTNTPGKVTVTFTTERYDGQFPGKSFVAAWVMDQFGTFVKTLYVRCTLPLGGRMNHLVAWTADSGQDHTDAVTGATAMQHGQHIVEWNCTDTGGATVPDGTYRIRLEYTESNSAQAQWPAGPVTPADYLEVGKGTTNLTLSPAPTAGFTNVSLAYAAYAPRAEAGPDLVLTDSDGDGQETVILDGSASTDPNGIITNYSWFDGTTLVATGVTAEIDLGVNAHVLELRVTDDEGNTDSDALSVLVRPGDYDPAMVVHLKLDGSAADATGNGHDGTPVNGAGWTGAGRIGGAALCDGADDYISVPNSALINTATHTTRSVSAWIMADDPGVSSRKQIVYEEGGTARGLAIYLFDGRVYLAGWNAVSGESDWSGTYLSNSLITASTWHHLALVLDGTASLEPDAFSAYLDGRLIGTGEGSQLWAHSDAIGIGGLNGSTLLHDGTDTGSHGFAGRLDDVRIYNRALSPADVDALARNDLDRDDMPDDWERRFFATTYMLPGADEDGDGLSNLAEYGADTDPTNAASALRITGVDLPGDDTLRVHWQGGENARQTLERAEAARLAATGWTTLVTLDPPTPVSTNVVLPVAETGTVFYRIRAVRP